MTSFSYVFWVALSAFLVCVTSLDTRTATTTLYICTAYLTATKTRTGCNGNVWFIHGVPSGTLKSISGATSVLTFFWPTSTMLSTTMTSTKMHTGWIYTTYKETVSPCNKVVDAGYLCWHYSDIAIQENFLTIYKYIPFNVDPPRTYTIYSTVSTTVSSTVSVTQSITKSVTQSVTQSITQSVTQSVTQYVTEALTKSVCKGADGINTLYTTGTVPGRSTSIECLSPS